jgi:hypothetical protein
MRSESISTGDSKSGSNFKERAILTITLWCMEQDCKSSSVGIRAS